MRIENGVLMSITNEDIQDGKFVIPEGVTAISYYAFADCISLTEVKIPEGVTYIGGYAFSGCSSLTKVEIPEGVTTIAENAFSGCSSLTEVKIPEGVTTIGGYAFNGCSSLTKVEIPEGVTTIGGYAFNGCSSLTEVKIPEGVTHIVGHSFNGCSSLTKVEIPEGVTTIGGYAFNGCSSLTEIKIPEGVTTIGAVAFNGCSSLTKVEIPEGVTTIADKSFSGCSSLTEVKIPEGVTDIGRDAFSGCSSLTEVKIPEGVTDIGSDAFSGCSSLTEVKIPEGVTDIPDGLFNGCSSLTEIEIPETVEDIGLYVFDRCDSLDQITLKSTRENILFRLYSEYPEKIDETLMFGEDISRFNSIKSQANFKVSRDYDKKFMDQLYHKIIFSIGIDELENIVRIPNLSEEEIKRYTLDKEEGFGILYETKYKIQGDLGTTLKILKELKSNTKPKYNSKNEKNTAEMHILRELNKLLEEGKITNLTELITTAIGNAGYDSSEIKEKINELERGLNKSQFEVNIGRCRKKLFRCLELNVENEEGIVIAQRLPIEKMLEDKLKKIYIENGRIDIGDLRDRLLDSLNSPDRALYIRQQAGNIVSRVMSLIEKKDNGFLEIMNHNSVNSLRSIKEQIGGRWIRRLTQEFNIESLSEYYSEEEIKALEGKLGIKIEIKKEGVLKGKEDREKAYKLLEKRQEQMPEEEKVIITYKQLHDMFRTSTCPIYRRI